MIKVNVSSRIHRSCAEIFDYISNFENNPYWQGGMIEAKFTSDDPLGKGSTYEQTATFLGKRILSTFEVTAYEKNRMIKIQSISGTFPITVTRMVQADRDGSIVSAVVEGDARGFFKLAQPLLQWMVKQSVKSDYRRLKKQLEGRV